MKIIVGVIVVVFMVFNVGCATCTGPNCSTKGRTNVMHEGKVVTKTNNSTGGYTRVEAVDVEYVDSEYRLK